MTKKKLLLAILIILVAGGIVVALELTHVINLYTKNRPQEIQQNTEVINLSPPTEDEKQAGDEQKNKNEAQENTEKNSPTNPSQSANVIITDAGQYDNVIEVRSFIQNHYQDGTCNITLTKGGLTVSKSTPAYRDVSTTICTNPLFNRSEFAEAGDWTVTVEYVANNIKGTSEPKLISIK